jgi:cytochrome c
MRSLRSGAVLCAIVLTASLLLARAHPFGDAGLYRSNTASAPLLQGSSVPDDVKATLTAKCADCHSMQTRLPAYGRVAPLSWLMERDILEGRKAMNLSQWDSYSTDQQQFFKAKIVLRTREREMPLLQYRLVHWDARITERDMQSLTRWAQETSGDESKESMVHKGDPARGKETFEKRCTGCHALTSDREGPCLHGVFGRTSGTVPDFPYSDALKNAHIVWNEATLEKWLTDPDVLVPGNNMEFHVANPQERQDLIQFLKANSSK